MRSQCLIPAWCGQAGFGAIVWAVMALSAGFDGLAGDLLLGPTLLLAPLVLVPLGLSLTQPVASHSLEASLRRWAGRWHLFGVLSASMSLVVPEGPLAGALASTWVLSAALLALSGLARLKRGGIRRVEELSIAGALVHLPVGAAWLVASRMGWSLGFPPVIVFLTAMHFHYAGFAAPMVSGLLGRWLRERSQRVSRLYRVGASLVLGGPILLALGIAFSPLVELAMAVLLSGGILIVAAQLVFVVAPQVPARPAQLLFTLAGASMGITMLFAVAYSLGEFLGQEILTINQMVLFHGMANAYGFSLGSLIAWRSLRSS